MEKESMVIYKSIISAIDLLPNTEQKWEAIKGITDFGFYDKKPESENPIINMIYIQAIPSLRNAGERYEKAVENGKRGGRPSTVDKEQVIQLKKQGKTYQEISDELNCPKNTIKKILQREGTKGTKGTNEVCTLPEEIDGVQRVQTLKVNTPENTQKEGWGTKGTNLSVSVSESVSVSDTDTDSDESVLCMIAPQVGYNPASPNNATDVAPQTNKLSNFIKLKIRDMWKPGVKQKDVVKNIKSEFGIDLTFAEVNDIWNEYKSFEARDKLKELVDKEKSTSTKQTRVSAKDKKHYNEVNRLKEILEIIQLEYVDTKITLPDLINVYNNSYEEAKTQMDQSCKHDFTVDQMLKFLNRHIETSQIEINDILTLRRLWNQNRKTYI